MSLIAIESFDLVDNATRLNLKQWFADNSGIGAPSILTLTGGRTGNGLQFSSGGIISFGVYLKKQVTPTAEHAQFALGFALYLNTYDTSIAQLMSDELATTHVTLGVGGGGQLHVAAGPGLPTVLSSPGLLDLNEWHYIELLGVLSSTTGAVSLQIDGVNVGFVNSIDTRNGGTKTVFDSLLFGTNGGNFVIDDVYLTNGGGSTNTGMLGDISVAVMRPDGNGATSELVNDAGNSTNNYSHVNSAASQFTTYVESATPGDEDTYLMTPISSAVAVHGLQTVSLADKNNSGTRSLEPVIHTVFTDYPGTSVALSTGAAYQQQIWEFDPSSSSTWTASGVNAAQYGARIE